MNEFPNPPFEWTVPVTSVGNVHVFSFTGGGRTFLYLDTSSGWELIGMKMISPDSFDVNPWIKKSLAKRQKVREEAVARLTNELRQAQEQLDIIQTAREETDTW